MEHYDRNLNSANKPVLNPLETLKKINRHIRKYNEANAAPGDLQKYPLKTSVCLSVFPAYALFIKQHPAMKASSIPVAPLVQIDDLEYELTPRHLKKLREAKVFLNKTNQHITLNPELLGFGGAFTEGNFYELETGDRSIE